VAVSSLEATARVARPWRAQTETSGRPQTCWLRRPCRLSCRMLRQQRPSALMAAGDEVLCSTLDSGLRL